jgi:hypothetical protein
MLFSVFFNELYQESTETVPNPNYREPHPLCPHADMNQKYCGHCGVKNEMVTYPEKVTRTTWTRDGKVWTNQDEALRDFLTELNTMERMGVNYKGLSVVIEFDKFNGNLGFLSPMSDSNERDTEYRISRMTMKRLNDTYVYLKCYELEYTPTIHDFKLCIERMEKFQSIGLQDIRYYDLRNDSSIW